jgi:hypothetical protein
MSAQVDERICVHSRAALAAQAFPTRTVDSSAEVEAFVLLELSSDLVGGDPQNPGVPHPEPTPVDPTAMSS